MIINFGILSQNSISTYWRSSNFTTTTILSYILWEQDSKYVKKKLVEQLNLPIIENGSQCSIFSSEAKLPKK